MKLHITNIYNQPGTQGIAQQKTAEIAKSMGFYEMSLFRYTADVDNDRELGTRLDGILASLQFGDIVFIQSPSWNGIRYDLRFVRKLKAYRGVKIVMLVHDVIPLAFNSGEDKLRATVEIYNHADLIIVPSEKMLNLLRRYGLTVKKHIIQALWDYPVHFNLEYPKFYKRLFFTGAPSRFPFVENWKYQSQLVMYTGVKFNPEGLNIKLRDYQKETKLLMDLSEGGYGLVWSSDEANSYYQLLQPYKIPSYLAAGIPVIMQKGLSPEKLIVENNLGFVAESLDEVDEIVQTTSEEQYNQMVQRISEFNFLIKDGWFTKKLLTDAVMLLLNDNYKE